MRGREPVKDKRNVLLSLVMGVAMAIIWSAAFVSLLDSPAGIGVGGGLRRGFRSAWRRDFQIELWGAAPVGIQSGFRQYFFMIKVF